MITNLLIDLVVGILSPIFSLLPSGSLVDYFPILATPLLYDVGAKLAPLNSWLPIQESVVLLSVYVGFIVPALLVYKAANWLYRHIPSIGGFGPGAG